MRCLSCSSPDNHLIHDTRELPYSFHGQSTFIPAVTGEYCPVCGEGVLALSESVRISGLMRAFNRQVTAATLKPGRAATLPRGHLIRITSLAQE